MVVVDGDDKDVLLTLPFGGFSRFRMTSSECLETNLRSGGRGISAVVDRLLLEEPPEMLMSPGAEMLLCFLLDDGWWTRPPSAADKSTLDFVFGMLFFLSLGDF